MQTKRRNNEPTSLCRAISKLNPRWSKVSVNRALAGTACLSLSLALTACGGNTSSGTSAEATPAAENLAEVAAAASAASSSTVSMETATMMNTSSLTADASVDRFIIKYKTGTTESGATTAVQSKLDRLASAFPARAHHLRRMSIGSDVVTTERKLNAREAKAFMRAIASDPNVEYVEPDTVMSATMSPNDPEYSKQWGLTSNLKPGTTTAGIRAEGAWDIAQGSGSVIAMLDTGVTSHSDLNANILPGYDFTANNRGGNGTNPGITTETCQVSWHGTHVAGIMAAVANNSVGIAGVAPAAKVVPVRVLNGCGIGYTSDIADGITWAAGGSVPGVPNNPYPAKVINVSLGGTGLCETTFQNAIDYATSQGALVVAATGNNNSSATNFEPANCRNVINVSATNRLGLQWSNSNYGAIVDISAPGDSIWSTLNSGTAAPGAESYGYMDGTSMAAPMVSGVIALAQSVAPKPLTPIEMRALLTENVQAFPKGQPNQPIGSGILDANAVVAAARAGKIPAAPDFTCVQSATIMQVTCTDLSTARGAPIASWTWNLGTGGPDTVRTSSINPYGNMEYPGTYEITLKLTDSTGAVSRLTRPFKVVPPASTYLTANAPVTFASKSGGLTYFEMDVPAGTKSLTYTLSSGSVSSQTAQLYVKAGTPSILRPDCLSTLVNGGSVTCTIANPSGSYYGIVNAVTKLTDFSIVATYTQ
jgi:serine protease